MGNITKIVFLVLIVAVACGIAVYPASREKLPVDLVFQPGPNEEWTLYIFGGRTLVCEDMMTLRLRDRKQPAVEPLVIECVHPKTETYVRPQ